MVVEFETIKAILSSRIDKKGDTFRKDVALIC